MSEHDDNHTSQPGSRGAASAAAPGPEVAPSELTAAEQEAASRLAEALAALDAGRAGLDGLPVLAEDDPLLDLVAMTHLSRSLGPAGTIDEARREALWSDIDRRLAQLGGEAPRSRWSRWWSAGVAMVSAAAAASALLLLGQRLVHEGPAVLPVPPQAVAQLESDMPRYAAELLAPGVDPDGDTRLRDLRRAHFDAWRADATWHRRYAAGRGQR